MLDVIKLFSYASWHYSEYHLADGRYAECRHAENRSAKKTKHFFAEMTLSIMVHPIC